MRRRSDRRDRRAEIASQALVYILGIVVVGLLLLLGYRALDSLNEKKCTVQDASFQTDLKAKLESNKGRGSSHTETFTPPCGVDEVCFVSRSVVDTITGSQTVDQTVFATADPKYQAIVNSVLSGDDTNVFVHTADGYAPLAQFAKAGPIELAGGLDAGPITCVSGEPLRILMLGRGQVVDVEKPQG